ncbi:hypothetical protein AB0D57_39155 [Streptomyces sp. NPDC048275]|uniref:hypothetical protein n=1 Tax=Streptomyces sp. NPDC048275 TaxID=3155629 RepID=UPI0033D6E563
MDELRDLLRVHTDRDRTAYRVPRPAPAAARGYESEIPSFSLLVLTCQIRDALNASSDEVDDTPTAEHIQLPALDRTRLLRSVSARDTDALDQAVDRLQTAVDSSTDEPLPWEWSFTLGDLAQSLMLRYEAVGQPSDLERAVDNAQAAIRLAQGAGEHDASLVWTGVLGAALRMRYEAEGDVGDLKAAADSLWETTNPTSLRVEQSVWTSWLCAVGALQRYHYALSDENYYLDRAYETHLSLARARASRDVHGVQGVSISPAVYASLGYSCLAMYERSVEPDLLDRAAAALDDALSLAGSGDLDPAEWAEWTGAFVTALRLSFERQGSLTHLERLITVLTSALESSALPELSPAHTAWLGTLGEALLWRFELSNAADDLRAARAYLGRARSFAALVLQL